MSHPLNKVLVTWYAESSELDVLRTALGTEVEIALPTGTAGLSRYECTYESIAAHLDADGIVGWVVPDGALEDMPNLRIISWLHAGIDELPLAYLSGRGVTVCNVRGANATAVAEHGVALLLALAKRIPVKQAAVRAGKYVPLYADGHRGALLSGRTLAIVGLGSIGSLIAERMSNFGMKIIGVRRNRDLGGGAHLNAVYGPDRLHHVLGEADFTILAVPITKRTAAMMGRAEFAAMKRGSYLINVARGNLIDEGALYDALEDGTLSGFASDVWWNYVNAFPATYHFPAPSRTGLHLLDSVVASGDQAGNADGVRELDVEYGSRSLAEFHRGDTPGLTVSLVEGY